VNRRTLTAWLALCALALQAAWPVTAIATAVPSDICGVGGPVPMPDPASPECRLHCASCLTGAGKVVLDTPDTAALRRPEAGVLRLPAAASTGSPAAPHALAAPARAPPAFS
jgi:hypothetical protein